jgi:hypothetical protein
MFGMALFHLLWKGHYVIGKKAVLVKTNMLLIYITAPHAVIAGISARYGLLRRR